MQQLAVVEAPVRERFAVDAVTSLAALAVLWEQSLMTLPRSYELAPSGSAALFDTDVAGGGTHLVLLPR
jgi:hypothetical protein